MIEARGLTKRYGQVLAVDALSFDVRPGVVTGFLGPNGSGKSTTMRLMLGLDAPDQGSVRIGGRRYRDLGWPLHEVGALLEAKAFHPARSARAHLAALAASNGIGARRVDEVLTMVGLHGAAGRRAGTLSLGMAQRLGIAVALLGDPGVLLFDEPVNGLDPEGIRWIRNLMQALAAEGRTVFVSSHLMSEMETTAQDIIVIGRGKLIANTTIDKFIAENSTGTVKVRTPQGDALAKAVAAAGGTATTSGDDALVIQGLTTDQVGDVAYDASIRLHELSQHRASLEQAFMELTADSVEYQASVESAAPAGGRHAAGPPAAAQDGPPQVTAAPPPPPQETGNTSEHAGRTS
jgi:ABC-2 type transport system ATP-binding protein